MQLIYSPTYEIYVYTLYTYICVQMCTHTYDLNFNYSLSRENINLIWTFQMEEK